MPCHSQLSPEVGIRPKDVNHPSGVLVHIWREAERLEQSLVLCQCFAQLETLAL